jgi:glycosyltransferase involved in cell wall biosynthesis
MRNKLKCLVVSSAAFTPINRNLYYRLADSYEINLLAPKYFQFGDNKHHIENLDFDVKNFEITPCRTFFNNNPRLTIYIGYLRAIFNFKPKYIILDYDPFSFITLISAFYSYFFGFKLVTFTYENQDIYNVKINSFKTLIKLSFIRVLSFLLKKNIFQVVTFNKSVYDIFKSIGFATSQTILGFDSNVFKIDKNVRYKIREELMINNNVVVIAYFGRLVPEKGVHLLINALIQLKKHNFFLMIDKFDVYKNDYSNIISRLLNSLDSSKVFQIDPTHDNIWEYMNACDLVVLPSIKTSYWEEQYGRVAAESMACGKLVLVSDTGHLPDLVGYYGEVFEENDVDSLVKTLIKFDSIPKIQNHIPELDIHKYAFEDLSINKQVSFLKNLMK